MKLDLQGRFSGLFRTPSSCYSSTLPPSYAKAHTVKGAAGLNWLPKLSWSQVARNKFCGDCCYLAAPCVNPLTAGLAHMT